MVTRTPWLKTQPVAAPPSSYMVPGGYPSVAASMTAGNVPVPPAWAAVRGASVRSASLGQAVGLGGSGWQPGRTEAAHQTPHAMPNPLGPTLGGVARGADQLSKTAGALPMSNLANVAQAAWTLDANNGKASAFAAPSALVAAPPRKCREGCVMRLNSSSFSRQHPSKESKGIPNADATEESPRLLGICDGDSGCMKLGISPDSLPHELLTACRNGSRSWFNKVGSLRDSDGRWLRSLIEEAFSSTRSLGSTTMLLASILDNGVLVTASVGGCSLLVLRVVPADKSPRTQVVFRTTATRYEHVQRLPNMPESRTIHVLQNAQCDTFMLQPSDYLVLGSDGLFENLQDSEIQEIIERYCPLGGVAQNNVLAEASNVLVDAAISKAASQAINGNGPTQNFDDTTALVASVVEVPDADEFDRWFWRSRGIKQPYHDSQPQNQKPNLARVQSNSTMAPLKTSASHASRVLQDCTNTAAGNDAKRWNNILTPSPSNNLGSGKSQVKGNGAAAPDWWSNMQVPVKPAPQAEQKYGEQNLASKAAQTTTNLPDQLCEDGVALPRLTSQVLRAHEARMALAPSIDHCAPGHKQGGRGVPNQMPQRQKATTVQKEECVIS